MLRGLTHLSIVVAASIGAVAVGTPSFAGELPRLELGLGVTGISVPDYRGSAEQQNYLLPFPFVVYRGERIRADRDGVRGLLFKSRRIELNASVGGYVPVDSEDNPQRQGMPDLDSTFEVGPSLNVNLSDSGARGPRFRIPLRASISIGSDGVSHAGWRVHPVFELPFKKRIAGFAVKMQIGPQFADSVYHGYYYSVADADVRPGRPAFSAGGGYSGLSFQLSATRRMSDRAWLGAFVRYDDLRETAFRDSPLVVDDGALLVGIAAAWIVHRSGRAESP